MHPLMMGGTITSHALSLSREATKLLLSVNQHGCHRGPLSSTKEFNYEKFKKNLKKKNDNRNFPPISQSSLSPRCISFKKIC